MTRRWQIFGVLALMFVVGFFFRVSMAVVSGDLATDLGLSAAQLGVLSGAFFYSFALAQIPLGPLIDRFGGRCIISLFGVATTCGSLTFALAPAYPAALTGRILLGLGTACVLMGSLKIYTRWFSPAEFPRVSGFMVAAGNLGNVTATAPLAYAVSHFGWRHTFLAASVAQAAVTAAVYATVRDTPDAAPAHAPGEQGEGGIFRVWRMLFTTPAFWLTSLIAFFWYANYMVLLALWGGPYLMEAAGLTRSQTGTTLLCTSIGFISGSLILGKVIDLLSGSLRKTIFAGQALLLVAMTAMLGPAELLSRPGLEALFFTIGLASASGVIIYPLSRLLIPERHAATAMTCVNFFLLMGAAMGQHAMGAYIGSFPRGENGYPAAAYHGAFLFPVCGLALALVLFAAGSRFGARRPDSGLALPHTDA